MPFTNTYPNIQIIFEDEHLLLVDKPVDLLSQADHTGDPDLVSLCKQYLQSKSINNPYIGLIHRLDRPVGGLLLLAKTKTAANSLSKQIRERTMQKTYWAVVSGSPPKNGVLSHYLHKDRTANIVKTVTKKEKRGKRAELSFMILERTNSLNLISIHLQTGRSHQIRVQMSAEGYPIWGDYKYGENQPDGRTIALRAVELIFKHPATNKEKHFELPVPKEAPWTEFNYIKS